MENWLKAIREAHSRKRGFRGHTLQEGQGEECWGGAFETGEYLSFMESPSAVQAAPLSLQSIDQAKKGMKSFPELSLDGFYIVET